MARAQSALVPVRRVRAGVPLARRSPVARDLESSRRPAPRCTTAWCAHNQSALSIDAVHLHGRGRYVSSRRHDDARARHGLSRRCRRRATCTMSTCSALRSSSIRCTNTRRVRDRSICRRAHAGTTSIRGAHHDGGQDIEAAAPLARMPLYRESGLDRAGRPGCSVHRRKSRVRRSRCTCSRARMAVRSVRRRRCELRLRDTASSRVFRCVTTQPRAHSPSAPVPAAILECRKRALSRCAGSRLASQATGGSRCGRRHIR